MIKNSYKKVIASIPVTIAFIGMMLTSCGSNSQSAKDEKKSRPKYSAAQGYGLQGPVKMVKDEEAETTLVFDKIGNVESDICTADYRSHNITYVYETPFRYSGDGENFTIECNDNSRFDIPEGVGTMPIEFHFDDKGRVIKYVYCEGMSPVTTLYFYDGKSTLPVKSVESSYDECGEWEVTRTFRYLDVDKKGNWTRRSVTMRADVKEYDQEEGGASSGSDSEPTVYEQTRKITYY